MNKHNLNTLFGKFAGETTEQKLARLFPEPAAQHHDGDIMAHDMEVGSTRHIIDETSRFPANVQLALYIAALDEENARGIAEARAWQDFLRYCSAPGHDRAYYREPKLHVCAAQVQLAIANWSAT